MGVPLGTQPWRGDAGTFWWHRCSCPHSSPREVGAGRLPVEKEYWLCSNMWESLPRPFNSCRPPSELLGLSVDPGRFGYHLFAGGTRAGVIFWGLTRFHLPQDLE